MKVALAWTGTIVLLLLTPAACAREAIVAEDMYIKSSQLLKLSSAVEALVRYKGVPADATEADVLRMATEHDPPLLQAFDTFTVRAHWEKRHSSVLVCSKDGKDALLEDASCTGEMDLHRWRAQPPTPCAFSLKLEVLCGPD